MGPGALSQPPPRRFRSRRQPRRCRHPRRSAGSATVPVEGSASASVPGPRRARRHWGRSRRPRSGPASSRPCLRSPSPWPSLVEEPAPARGRVLAIEGRPGDRRLGFGEFLAGDFAVRVERVPDFRREGAAEDRDPVDARHFDVVGLRVADPDHGREVRLVAGEPGVGVVVGRPGLARLAGAAGVGRGAGAAGDVVVEQAGDLVGDRFGDDPLAGRRARGGRRGRRGRRPGGSRSGCGGCRPRRASRRRPTSRAARRRSAGRRCPRPGSRRVRCRSPSTSRFRRRSPGRRRGRAGRRRCCRRRRSPAARLIVPR